MPIDTGYDEQQRAFADAVRELARRRAPEWASGDAFPEETWRDLARIGLFALAVDGVDAAVETAAVCEALGGAGCPGPLWETVTAVRAAGPDLAAALAAADQVATVVAGGLAPWGGRADAFFALSAAGLAECAPPAPGGGPVTMIGGGRWTRVRPEPVRTVDPARGAVPLGEVALAAYLCGAAGRLLADAAAYAASRHQFRRPIGDFQAVAFALAEADVAVAAARNLVRRAAYRLATGCPGADRDTRAAVLSAARAARTTTHHTFQAYGAMAFTEENGTARLGRRIAVLLTQALAAHRRDACLADLTEATR